MIFYNDKINLYLQDLFKYTDEQMQAMRFAYIDAINKMILDECISYAENNNIEEFSEIKKMLKVKTPIISKQTQLLQNIMQLPGKYPELYKKIAQEIERIDSELLGEITKDMKEEDAIGLLRLIKEELDQVDKFSSKYLQER